MTNNYLANAGEFLISLLISLFMIIVMFRFLLQVVRADFYNPISQAIVKITNPVLLPMRKFIPGYAGIDWSSVLLLILLQGIELFLIALLKLDSVPTLSGLLILILAHLLKFLVYVYIFLIVFQVIISWVNPGAYSHFTIILYQLTEPIIRPVRRNLPATGGLDWSPLVILIVLQLMLILLVAPLQDLGNALSGYPRRFL